MRACVAYALPLKCVEGVQRTVLSAVHRSGALDAFEVETLAWKPGTRCGLVAGGADGSGGVVFGIFLEPDDVLDNVTINGVVR